MSNAISDIGNAISNTVSSVGHAISNPSNLIGTGLGFGIGGAGGLTGGNLFGNAATGQPLGTNLQGAATGDLLGLAAGGGIAGMMGPGADPFAGFTIDPNTGDVIPVGGGGGGGGLFGGYTVDPNTGDVIPGGGGAGGAAGGGGLGGMGGLAGGTGSILNRLLGGAVSGSGGGNAISNFLTGQGGGASLPSLAPGLAALQYARNQTPINTDQLQGVFNAAGSNQPAFIQAAQHPLQQAQAGGYGDILQSQAARGIRGSSFGDQDISNYLTDTNRGIADAGTNAAQASLGLQGNLAGQISNLNALSQQMKNNLYGRAFSSLGQGLNPTPGMGGMNGGGSMGSGGFMGGQPGGMFNNLGLGGIGNAFGNGLSGIGSGLGNLFGSPGSSIWSGPAQLPIQGMPTDFLGDMAGF